MNKGVLVTMTQDCPNPVDKDTKIIICASRWHGDLVDSIVSQTREELFSQFGLRIPDEHVIHVPGSWELPFAAQKEIERHRPSCVLCFGILVKGDTDHYDRVSECVAQGLMTIQLTDRVPIVNAVLSCQTLEQVRERTLEGKSKELARSYAATAVRMASL
jgi:6,7-dimethyl-8-ribityllumazine synthase